MNKRPVPSDFAANLPFTPALFAGDHVFVSGQVGIDPRSGELAGPDVQAQTEQVISNIQALLESAGQGLADVIKTTVFLTEASDLGAMNKVYGARFPEPYPTRSTVIVRALARPDLIVEIEAIALRSVPTEDHST